eukprot:TCONS_00012096-protein
MISKALQYVLCYETLFGKGLHQNSKYEKFISTHEDKLKATLDDLQKEEPGLFTDTKKNQVVLPRYVRVNVLKCSMDVAINRFQTDGFNLVSGKEINEISGDEFVLDKDIPNVLVFPPNTDLHQYSLYKEGKLFLQDKASCLSAYVLNPPERSLVIDGCAAPGNKTTHLACILNNNGSVYSFDLDKKRLRTMEMLVQKAGATCVTPKHQDFLKVRHDDKLFSKVEYILLDPSCSGSGIVGRMDNYVDDDEENATNEVNEKRLKALSGFQTAALSHALTFPNVQKVLYSTCSIHKQENEDVIEKAFKRFEEQFDLCHVMPSWKSRGQGEWELAYKCIRAVPEKDFTNGFFVAMFERKQQSNFQNGTKAVGKEVQINGKETNAGLSSNGIVNSEKKRHSNPQKGDSDVKICDGKYASLTQCTKDTKIGKHKARDTGNENDAPNKKIKINVDEKSKQQKVENIFAKKVPSKRKRRLNERVKKPLI